jgi:hypothetical protein
MDSPMEKASALIKMAQSTKVIGKVENAVEKERKGFLMDQFMKVILKKIEPMETE